jgi:hypothetical protein
MHLLWDLQRYGTQLTGWRTYWDSHKIQLHICYYKSQNTPTCVNCGQEVETKLVDGVLTHGNWWLSQEEASVKQEENKDITPEPWEEVEARRDFGNILKSHLHDYYTGFLFQ